MYFYVYNIYKNADCDILQTKTFQGQIKRFLFLSSSFLFRSFSFTISLAFCCVHMESSIQRDVNKVSHKII